VDVAVIETGLGGRLDATNVLRPLLAVITDISFDHVEILGPTLTDIAREKAGIVKPGAPTLIGLLPPQARRVIAAACRQIGSPLIQMKRGDFSASPDGCRLDYDGDTWSARNIPMPLAGAHQAVNTALVLKAIEELRRAGLKIQTAAIRRGLATTSWPGRFQILKASDSGPTIVLDVCHNPGGAAAFIRTFRQVFPGRRTDIIAGFVKRKAHQEMVDQLAAVARSFRLVTLPTGRSAVTAELAARLDWHELPVRRHARLDRAYERLLSESGPNDIISIVGSHYLVGSYLERYERR